MGESPLTVVCWKWKQPGFRVGYSAHHVNVLAAMVARHYKKPHRFVCITDDPTGIECETMTLWDDFSTMQNACGQHLPSCYRRLKLFSKAVSSQFGGRIVSLDLDVVILDDLSPLWDQPHDFMGWRVVGINHPVVYNGSMFMFRAGKHTELWNKFDPTVSPDETKLYGYFGSDQAWISYKIAGSAPGWTQAEGVYSYPREQRRRDIRPGTRMVIFHGKRKPWDALTQAEAPWIAKHWRLEDGQITAAE